MNRFDVIIIGGGAAGLTAALSASRAGAKALVLEAAPRIGRKILAAGNGRCNLANSGANRYAGDAAFADAVLDKCPVSEMLTFLGSLGLTVCEEAGGRIYPACGQAAAVLDVLRLGLERQGVALITDAPVTLLQKEKGAFRARTPQGDFAAPAVVAAFGGMAGGRLGHDGAPYRLLTGLGHTLRPPRPALTPLIAEKGDVKGLSGLRLPAVLTLCDGGDRPVAAAQGEALFTDYGVSGVCAMQLSRKTGEMLRAGQKPVLYLDFSPMLGLVPRLYDRVPAGPPRKNLTPVRAFLRTRAHTLPREVLLTGLLPRLLVQRLSGLSPDALADALCAFPVRLTDVKGFENAQVTAGGVPGEEFDPQTLQSRLVSGLFAAGELLDVDGDCGGFNLQFAFASGILAGRNAANFQEVSP